MYDIINRINDQNALTKLDNIAGNLKCIRSFNESANSNVKSLNYDLGLYDFIVMMINVQANPSATDPSKIIRFFEDGTNPDTTHGLFLGDGSVYELKGLENINQFKFISVDGLQHTLAVNVYANVQSKRYSDPTVTVQSSSSI